MKRIFLPLLAIIFSFYSTVSYSEYDMVMARNNYKAASWTAIKFDVETGRSWLVRSGVFKEILEKKIPYKGRYKVLLVETPTGWGATRLEIETGKGWFLMKGVWEPIRDLKD